METSWSNTEFKGKGLTFLFKRKQKLRYHYGLTEKQLVNYVRKAKKSKGATGNSLIQLLELRLDNIVFRLGIGVSLQAARQEVTHRHIFVNSDCVSFPASACSLGDVISVDRSLLLRYQSRISKKKPLQLRSRRPRFLKRFHVDRKSRKFFGSIRRHPSYRELPFKLNVLLVIEYYSRKI